MYVAYKVSVSTGNIKLNIKSKCEIMILYIFINCHYNQLLKKFEYYPPINLILFTQKELWVLSETVFFYCVKRLYRHASSSFDVVLGRQKEVLFFSVCVRACQHRPFTLEPKQKRERKVVKKRALQARPLPERNKQPSSKRFLFFIFPPILIIDIF